MGLFIYLLFTLCIELPVICIFYRKNIPAALVFAILVNCFSWPVFQLIRESAGDAWIPFLEIVIVIIEAIGFKIFLQGKFSKALFVSLVANLVSYCAGFLID